MALLRGNIFSRFMLKNSRTSKYFEEINPNGKITKK